MLVDKNDYMTAGVYIGMKSCTPYMKRFVYKRREDGLSMFNLKKIDERLMTAASFLSRFDKIMIVSRKENAHRAIKKFAELVNSKVIAGRFFPGTLTNPSYREFYEPDVVFIVDPLIDSQAIKEAKRKRIPIISFCNTFNSARDIDFIIPLNNNGKRAIALALYLITREYLKVKGEIKRQLARSLD